MSTLAPDRIAAETTVLTLTAAAAERIKSLRDEKGLNAEHGLRVFVAGGGCSGLQYGMAFDNNPQISDEVVEHHGVKLIVDSGSLPYLLGAHIDFIDTPMGGGFRIENPNVESTCACGGSCGCH